MRWILKGIDETDRYGFNTQVKEGPDNLSGLFRVQGLEDAPVASDPLLHLEAISSGDQRPGEFSE